MINSSSKISSKPLSNKTNETSTKTHNDNGKSNIGNTNWKEELILYFYNEIIPYASDVWDNIEKPPDEISMQDSKMDKQYSMLAVPNNSFATGYSGSYVKSHSKLKNESFLNIQEEISTNTTQFDSSPNQKPIIEETAPGIAKMKCETEYVHIKFKNSNEYIGFLFNKIPNGKGKYTWSDGAYYEGEFKNGQITGEGVFKYTECSYYEGHFCNGLLHGFGTFNPLCTSMFYNGFWKFGKKHGKGWMLYKNGNFYDGDWHEDLKHGNGFRQYMNGTVYSGSWLDGHPNGSGIIYYHNNDFYNGEWLNGKPHGYGEYTWNASLVRGFALSMENIYQGSWVDGKRNGYGLIHFGLNGTKLASVFSQNEKNGAGVMVCSDGSIIEKNPLFINDSVVYQRNSAVTSTGTRLKSSRRSSSKSSKSFSKSLITRYGPGSTKSLKKLDAMETGKDTQQFVIEDTKVSKTFPDILPQYQPLEIPVHGIPAYINLKDHISKLIDKYCELTINPAILNVDPIMWNLYLFNGESIKYLPMNYKYELINYNFEERKLRNTLICHYKVLENLYNKYASLTCTHVQITPIMSRLFLWQMYKDLETHTFGLSLIDIDILLNEFPNSALESDHYPFEKIYIWQFLHSMLLVAYIRYASLKYFEEKKNTGILSNMLKDFINEYVKPNEGKFNGQCLGKYKDLLPIDAIYCLYQEYGEPHTAHNFLHNCCVKTGEQPPCYLKSKTSDKDIDINSGINMICTGVNLLYMPEKPTGIAAHPKEKCKCPFDQDLFNHNMKVFRTLGPKKILECLSTVCPLITHDGLVTNINYKLTFLEFYETVLLCALELIEHYKQEETKLLNGTELGTRHISNEKFKEVQRSTKNKGQKGKKLHN